MNRRPYPSPRIATTVLAASVVLAGGVARAEEPPAPAAPETVYVAAVVVEGLVQTRRRVVDRALRIDAGRTLAAADVERAVERLRYTGLFSSVEWHFADERVAGKPDDVRVLHVVVRERRSVRPILALDRGPDRSRLLLGAQETNAGGDATELGARVERIDDDTSVDAWMHGLTLHHPSFADLAIGLQTRRRDVYDDAGAVVTSFVRERRSGALALGIAPVQRVRITAGLTSLFDRYEGPAVPRSTRAVELGTAVRLDFLYPVDWRARGFDVQLRGGVGVLGAARHHAEAAVRGFIVGPLGVDVGARAELGVSNAAHPGDHYFVGGLNGVRTVVDGRYSGARYWVANAELRVPSLRTSWLVVQHAAFVDVASVTEVDILDEVGVGGGLRLIALTLGNLTLRLDLGWSLREGGPPQVSFGTGQFF